MKTGTQAAMATGLAVLGSVAGKRIPSLLPNPKVDVALKAAVGVALALTSAVVKGEAAKTALVALGLGYAYGAIARAYPVVG
jgi:hypothetical protein